MDIVSRLNKQNHRVALQARRLNNAAKDLLDKKVAKLEENYERKTKFLEKETVNIENILKDLQETPRSDSVCSESSWEEEFILPSTGKKLAAPPGWSGVKTKLNQRATCRYVKRKKMFDCKYFPCNLPETYNSLGFQCYPMSYTSLSNYEKLTHKTRPKTAASVPLRTTESQISISATPRLTTKDKIRGLSVYIKELKAKNDKKKPQAWEVRYGEPIPRRLLLKTAVPVNKFY